MTKIAKSILMADRKAVLSEEQMVGGPFEGESLRENRVGVDREVDVNIYRRPNGSYFIRIILQNPIHKERKHRYEDDIDRYWSEAEFMQVVMAAAGSLAEEQNLQYGTNWDTDYIAREAVKATKALLYSASDPDKIRGL